MRNPILFYLKARQAVVDAMAQADERGQGSIELAIIVLIVIAVVITALRLFGVSITDLFNRAIGIIGGA